MRFLSGLVFGAIAAIVFACSGESGNGSPPANPEEGGPSSSSGGSSGAASSSGGSSGTPASDDIVTTTVETMQHEGAARKYVLSVPKNYDAAKKYPLWIFMTGDPVNAEAAAGFKLHNVSKDEAIIVYPSAADTAWNHGAWSADNADSTFLLALIDALAGKYSIDTKRVLLDGWSNGAFMASAMACRYSSKFRAIGVQAGGAPYDENNPNGVPDCAGAAIAAFVSHGKDDVTVDFNEYAGQYWSEHAGCSANRSASTPAPCETYDGCPADKPVKVCFMPGTDHYSLLAKTFSIEWAWFKALP